MHIIAKHVTIVSKAQKNKKGDEKAFIFLLSTLDTVFHNGPTGQIHFKDMQIKTLDFQPAITCSKLKKEQGVKYIKSLTVEHI